MSDRLWKILTRTTAGMLVFIAVEASIFAGLLLAAIMAVVAALSLLLFFVPLGAAQSLSPLPDFIDTAIITLPAAYFIGKYALKKAKIDEEEIWS